MKKIVFPDVAKKFDKFPKGYVNDAHGWTFTRKEVLEAKEKGSLLTLDIDLPGKGACHLKCRHCFRKSPEFKKIKNMDMAETKKHLEHAARLGLKSVKIIGPGEPLEDPHLFGFLKMCRDLGVIPLIFTKGHPIADDALAMKRFGMNGRELLQKLNGFSASVLLGGTSFDSALEDSLVGKKGYHAARQEALLRLVEAGFNDFIPGTATRLALICAPVTPKNIDEAFNIYKWAKLRNIQPCIAPTMNAGGASCMLGELIIDGAQLIDLYARINVWAIENGMMSLMELEEQGISPYPGAAPCNQIAVGAFLRGDGKVLRCPGDDFTILGDLNKQTIEEIWENSENVKKYAGMYNNYCPPKDGISFPAGFFDKVMAEVRRRLGSISV